MNKQKSPVLAVLYVKGAISNEAYIRLTEQLKPVLYKVFEDSRAIIIEDCLYGDFKVFNVSGDIYDNIDELKHDILKEVAILKDNVRPYAATFDEMHSHKQKKREGIIY